MSKPGSKRLPGESGIVKAVREHREQVEKFMSQCVADVQGYTTGVNEQLMFQVGQLMTVQAALIEYLDELSVRRRDDVFAGVRIEAIVTQNIAKAKAEREAREAAKAAEVAEAMQFESSNRFDNERNAIPDGYCPSCGSASPEKCNVPCTDLPASAYRSVDDPAHIVPEVPADEAPAQPVEGS